MRVLVTGVKGQLGYDVIKCLEYRVIEAIGADIEEFDVTNFDKTREFITNSKVD